jgi:hypothetical protein
MDNSMCRNGHEVSGKFNQGSIEGTPHPPYSPDRTPCDFWLFGLMRHPMKDREFQSQQEILQVIAKRWDDVTFAEVQHVFWEWIEHLTWVTGTNQQYYPNSKTEFETWLNI